jgi:RHS repeat-associated protein
MPLARVDGANVYYYHTDQLGTPQSMTNSSGTTVWQATYEPFGKATVNEDPDGNGGLVKNHVRLPGQYYDQETGLHYNWHRYYDPKIGRYISSDPIGLAGGLNTYLYARANPLLYLDPDGLDAEVGIRKFYPTPVPYARHCFVRFNKNNSDTLSFDKRGVHADPNPGAADYSPTAGKENDSCVRQKMKKCEAETYDFTDFNCCHCVSNALNACGLQKAGAWPNAPYGAGKPPYVPVQPPRLPQIGDVIAP